MSEFPPVVSCELPGWEQAWYAVESVAESLPALDRIWPSEHERLRNQWRGHSLSGASMPRSAGEC